MRRLFKAILLTVCALGQLAWPSPGSARTFQLRPEPDTAGLEEALAPQSAAFSDADIEELLRAWDRQTILYLDDDQVMQDMWPKALQAALPLGVTLTVRTAATIDEALAILEELEHVALILTDYDLEEGTGVQFRNLVMERFLGRAPPVVLMAARDLADLSKEDRALFAAVYRKFDLLNVRRKMLARFAPDVTTMPPLVEAVPETVPAAAGLEEQVVLQVRGGWVPRGILLTPGTAALAPAFARVVNGPAFAVVVQTQSQKDAILEEVTPDRQNALQLAKRIVVIEKYPAAQQAFQPYMDASDYLTKWDKVEWVERLEEALSKDAGRLLSLLRQLFEDREFPFESPGPVLLQVLRDEVLALHTKIQA